jgi:hypothetical protein
VARKQAKSGAKTKQAKRATKPAARTNPNPRDTKPAAKAAATPAPRASRAAAATARPPSAIEQAEALRDAVQRSKLTASDPWAYTAKARGWAQRAQELVDRLARSGESDATRQALSKLGAEVEGDRDFQEARRLF